MTTWGGTDEVNLMNGASSALTCKDPSNKSMEKRDIETRRQSLCDKLTDLEAPPDDIIGFPQQQARPTKRLMEILDVPSFLVPPTTGFDGSWYSCTIPSDELNDTERIKYYLDVYQLFSMRQLMDRAYYTDGKEQVSSNVFCKYTCAMGDECCWRPVLLSRDDVKTKSPSSGGTCQTARGSIWKTLTDIFRPPAYDMPLVLEHSCQPQCQWRASLSSPLDNMKPQGYVLSPSLRFAIVSKYLHQHQQRQGLEEPMLIKTFQADQPELLGESLRRRMNQELGLEVTELQWKLTLQQFHRFFLRSHVDRSDPFSSIGNVIVLRQSLDQRDVSNLSTWDYWRIHKGTKRARGYLFYPVARDTDSTLGRNLKQVFLYTLFPVLLSLQCVVAFVLQTIFFLLANMMFIFLAVSCFPCCCYYNSKRLRKEKAQLKCEKERFAREGIATFGFVSDRWIVRSEDLSIHCLTVSYFEMDGTRVNVKLYEKPNYLYSDIVPMLTLPDRPMSGLPQRLIHSQVDLDWSLLHHVQDGSVT